MITYKVVDNCKGLYTYGIIAVDSEEIIAEIDDVTANRKALTELAELMNRDRLSLLHFKDAVEDFLVREY